MNKSILKAFMLMAFLVPALLQSQDFESIQADQRNMIGLLSGEYQQEGGVRMNARSSKEERAYARKFLAEQIQQIGLEPKEHSYRMPNLNPLIDLLFAPFTGANVYTVLPATETSDEYIVLGGHFDTEIGCPGAIDNGTGITLAYSVTKELSKLSRRTKNVMLVFFDQEEEDLVGSQAFAKYLKREGLKVHSVHTFDMVGWDGDGNKEIELEIPTPELEELYRNISSELGIPVYVANINSTDHHSFRKLGFPAVGVNEAYGKRDTSPYKDTPDDTFETVNFDYLTSSTIFVYEAIKELVSE